MAPMAPPPPPPKTLVRVNNPDVLGLYRRLNRLIEELYKSASSGVSEMNDFDRDHSITLLKNINEYHGWVIKNSHYGITKTCLNYYDLDEPPVVDTVENEVVNDLIRILINIRDELINSQSKYDFSNLCGFDKNKFKADIKKCRSLLLNQTTSGDANDIYKRFGSTAAEELLPISENKESNVPRKYYNRSGTLSPRHNSDLAFNKIKEFFEAHYLATAIDDAEYGEEIQTTDDKGNSTIKEPINPLTYNYIIDTLNKPYVIGMYVYAPEKDIYNNDVLTAVFEHSPHLISKISTSHVKYKQMAEIAVGFKPSLLEDIKNQWHEVCEIGVNASAHTLKYVKSQTAPLCHMAMSKDPSVYKILDQEFKTYEYLMEYKNHEYILDKMLIEILKDVPNIRAPKINRNFGVEIEFIVASDIDEVFCLLKKVVELDSHIHEGSDDTSKYSNKTPWKLSTDYTDTNMFEVKSCILNDNSIPQLYKVAKVLSVLEQFERIKITDKCGLHVHMDAADLSFLDVIKAAALYKNSTVAIQKLLSDTRSGNQYCETPTSRRLYKWGLDEYTLERTPIKELKTEKYYSVNPLSYFYYKSIEFRQHESTFRFNEIMYWVYVVANIISKRNDQSRHYLLNDLFDLVSLPEQGRNFYTTKYKSTPI